MKQFPYRTFETEMRVRPDDIDLYQHVHNSRYFDYVLAARYDQMERCYGRSMQSFMTQGYGWLVRAVYLDYKRALTMGDYFVVKTGIQHIDHKGCRVDFLITIKRSGKVSCEGWFDFVMIDLKTGKGMRVPDEVVQHYQG